MDKLPTTKQELDQVIQQGIETYMRNKQFNYSKIQNHEHNGVDTTKLPLSSIIDSIPLDGTPGGVVNSNTIGTNINLDNLNTSDRQNSSSIYVNPIHIIYGYGIGVTSAFNGGNAKPGTMIVFDNNGVVGLSQLWIKTENAWLGFESTLVQ